MFCLIVGMIATLCGFAYNAFDASGYKHGISESDRETVDNVLENDNIASILESGEGAVTFISPDGEVLYSKSLN